MTEEELFAMLDKWAVARLPVLIAQALADYYAQEQHQPPEPQLNRQDEQIAGIVYSIWRDQGRQAVRTKAVAMRMNYSPEWTLELLKQAECNGAITSIAGRGSRHSGRFLPIERAA